MGDVKYTHFANSDAYPLFKYVIEDYKRSLIDKMLLSDDKDKVWEYRQSIKTLERFQQHIEFEAGNKEE